MSEHPTFQQYTPGCHIVRPIPFKAHKINGFTPELLERHYEDVYGGLIRQLNKLETSAPVESLNDNDALAWRIARQKHSTTVSEITLHEVYFDSLAENGGEELTDPLLSAAISARYGSLSAWQSEFLKLAHALNAGYGWVLLVWSNRLGRLETITLTDLTPGLFEYTPILALDMEEHAYAADFGDRYAEYISAFVDSIHWTNVSKRFSAAQSSAGFRSVNVNDPHQINVAQLKSLRDHNADEIMILDVRHDDDCERYRTRIKHTDWRDSFKVDSWVNEMPKDKPIVVYCMYGFWVSQKVAEELRAEGFDARSLAGGVSAWRAMGYPTSETR